MRRFVITLLIIFSICVLTNCSQPIGTLEGGKDTAKYSGDPMWLIPSRVLYQIDERYDRKGDPPPDPNDPKKDEKEKNRYKGDFQLFMVLNGEILGVDIYENAKDITVEISKDINLSTEFHDNVVDRFYPFFKVGRHIVTVQYLGRTGSYSIEVFSPNNGNSIGGDGGIGIVWME